MANENLYIHNFSPSTGARVPETKHVQTGLVSCNYLKETIAQKSPVATLLLTHSVSLQEPEHVRGRKAQKVTFSRV